MATTKKSNLLPRWRWKNGAIRYQVPKGCEHLWDGKKEFTLGNTEMDAYKTWHERAELNKDNPPLTVLFDRCQDEVGIGKHLRAVFGLVRLKHLEPMHVHAYRNAANRLQSQKDTDRDIEVLRYCYDRAMSLAMASSNPVNSAVPRKIKPKKVMENVVLIVKPGKLSQALADALRNNFVPVRAKKTINEHARTRSAKIRNATPLWADLAEIKKIYQEAKKQTLLLRRKYRRSGRRQHLQFVVDHIIPLQHKKVCGLHVADNLRVIPYLDNARKYNSFSSDNDVL